MIERIIQFAGKKGLVAIFGSLALTVIGVLVGFRHASLKKRLKKAELMAKKVSNRAEWIREDMALKHNGRERDKAIKKMEKLEVVAAGHATKAMAIEEKVAKTKEAIDKISSWSELRVKRVGK